MPPQFTRIALFLFAGLLTILPSACVYVGSTSVTEQSVGELLYRDLVGNDSTEDFLDRITIKAVAVNKRMHAEGSEAQPSHNGKEPDGFWVILSVSPRPWDLSFDPRAVHLEIEQGQDIPAKGFTGPFTSQFPILSSLVDVNNLNGTRSPFPIAKEVTLGVLFDTPQLPAERRFTMILNGLSRSGQPIHAPLLQFHKRTTYRKEHPAFLLCFHCGSQREETWVVDE